MRGDNVPIIYKIDALAALKDKGYTAYMLRKNKILGGSTLQKLRDKKPLSWENIETLCRLLDCQPGEILEYIPDDK